MSESQILVHMCCGPCAIYPVRVLREKGFELMGYFHRSNIHPYTECQKREETLDRHAASQGIRIIREKGYDIEEFLRNVAFREKDRCIFCYHSRLQATAHLAKKGHFEGFTTTLLYSKFQRHDQIRSIGESIGKSMGVPFIYFDFREGWQEGITASRESGMYRQQYCGCIFSEKERFFKDRKPQFE